jgi:glucose-6-phosphate isomerase/transaldolase/glucose-6-phosphate isomerase
MDYGMSSIERAGRLPDVEAALAGLDHQDVIGRIWRRDHTVWKPDPKEISNRLGWLNVTEVMNEHTPALESFAREVKDAGFRNVVLLGMGGSSLGPEVIRQVFGSRDGYPELIVLDSTVPAWVQGVTSAIDPARTLFLVSSKSGTTIEPLFLFQHFWAQVESAVGRGRAGQHFVAITDPGTPLAGLADERGFRRAFLNPPDIGGRYSVLSFFGLVPAALIGIDTAALLDRADRMREGCASGVRAADNPGAWLGATMGALARRGADKLTIVTSPSVGSFGLWAEQLVAESTGKEGKGIIPIAGEPLVEPDKYGDDRLFVFLRLEGDDNSALDSAMEALESSGKPVLVLSMRDKLDLGAEFYRWEFATAVAGAVLGINPFDHDEYLRSGRLTQVEEGLDPSELLSKAHAGSYLAVMAYTRPSPEIESAIAEYRRKMVERYSIATTFGYGPRFLHSTGQLHKGGPDSGLFLQITTDHASDPPVPGEPYTFGVVADAQALGDLQALSSLGRPVARVHLGPGDHEVVRLLSNELKQSAGGM